MPERVVGRIGDVVGVVMNSENNEVAAGVLFREAALYEDGLLPYVFVSLLGHNMNCCGPHGLQRVLPGFEEVLAGEEGMLDQVRYRRWEEEEAKK